MKLKVVQKKPVFISIIFYAMTERKKKKKKSSTLDGFFCSVNLSVTPLLHFFAELLKKKNYTNNTICLLIILDIKH